MASVKERAYLIYKHYDKWLRWKHYIEIYEKSPKNKGSYFRNGRLVDEEEAFLKKKYFTIIEDELNGRNV